MRYLFLVMLMLLVGCGSATPPPAPPLKLQPPSTAPAPRKVFTGKGWEVSVEDDGWVKGTSKSFVLALISREKRVAVLLANEDAEGKTLEEWVTAQTEEFNETLTVSSEKDVTISGFPAKHMVLKNDRAKVWVWMTVANDVGYILVCSTPANAALENADLCLDAGAHLVVGKK